MRMNRLWLMLFVIHSFTAAATGVILDNPFGKKILLICDNDEFIVTYVILEKKLVIVRQGNIEIVRDVELSNAPRDQGLILKGIFAVDNGMTVVTLRLPQFIASGRTFDTTMTMKNISTVIGGTINNEPNMQAPEKIKLNCAAG